MILVFKTTVNSHTDAEKLTPHLNLLLPDGRWNFDLTDCDRVLRVDYPVDISHQLIHTLSEQGYQCRELE